MANCMALDIPTYTYLSLSLVNLVDLLLYFKQSEFNVFEFYYTGFNTTILFFRK